MYQALFSVLSTLFHLSLTEILQSISYFMAEETKIQSSLLNWTILLSHSEQGHPSPGAQAEWDGRQEVGWPCWQARLGLGKGEHTACASPNPDSSLGLMTVEQGQS